MNKKYNAMRTVRLIRKITRPDGRGPGNGQYALQRALAVHAPKWLKIGGELQADEVPWIWCWLDGKLVAKYAKAGRPFVVGPNVLFANSRHPGQVPTERVILNAESCQLIFTESSWYRDLIQQHLGPANRALIETWFYPIDPQPATPLSVRHDLLIYAKSGYDQVLLDNLQQRFRRSQTIVYGRYQRKDLIDTARSSACCIYLSDDDQGSLASGEIMLAGCPVVGIPRGAPRIVEGKTGVYIDRLNVEQISAAVERCHRLARHNVREAALNLFDTQRVVDVITASLQEVLDTQSGSENNVDISGTNDKL